MAPKRSHNCSKMGPGSLLMGPKSDLGSFGLLEGLLERSWRPPVSLLGAPGSLLDAPEGLLVESGTPLERSWSPPGTLLEPPGGRFESSWGPLGSVLSALGAILANCQKSLIFSMKNQ